MAVYGLTTNDIITAIQGENINISAGTLGVGRRDFRIRTTGEFNSPEEIAAVVIRSTGQQRVLLGDLAEIGPGFEKKKSVVLQNGVPGIAIGVRPEAGTNILDMTNRAEEKYLWLNEHKLAQQGLYLDWVYDQRFYINGAINQIKQNIMFGGLLAIGVLLLFLRSLRATIVVATAIPISVVGTFIFLDLLGRNLNVVSLAGIAFAVGMLVDNAIVVIENIDRHRLMGKKLSMPRWMEQRRFGEPSWPQRSPQWRSFTGRFYTRRSRSAVSRYCHCGGRGGVLKPVCLGIRHSDVFLQTVPHEKSTGRKTCQFSINRPQAFRPADGSCFTGNPQLDDPTGHPVRPDRRRFCFGLSPDAEDGIPASGQPQSGPEHPGPSPRFVNRRADRYW